MANFLANLKEKFGNAGFRRKFYACVCVVTTIAGAILLAESRLVQIFEKAAFDASFTSTTAAPFNITVVAKDLFKSPLSVKIICSSITGLAPLLLIGVLYFKVQWVEWVGTFCTSCLGKILVKVLSFTTLVFYFAARLGAKTYLYHHVEPASNLKFFGDNLDKIFDLKFETRGEITELVFVDPLTIVTVYIYSWGSLCFTRLLSHPEGLYVVHEVLLDLTCHLAADYFGSIYGGSLGVFVACLTVIIFKELTEVENDDDEEDDDEELTEVEVSVGDAQGAGQAGNA